MPKKYKTNKGTREFDDKLTRQEIEAQLIGEGVTEYEPLTSGKVLNINPSLLRSGEQFSGNTGSEAFADKNVPLSFGSAAASMARAVAASGAGRAAAAAFPQLRIPAAILGYTAVDQVGQQAQKSIFGERPKGMLEQAIEPENEVVGRLMGTAENAGLNYLGNKVGDKIADAVGSIYKKVAPAVKNKLGPVTPSPIIQPVQSGGKGTQTIVTQNSSPSPIITPSPVSPFTDINTSSVRHPVAVAEENVLAKIGMRPGREIKPVDELIANINRLTTPAGATALDDNMPVLSKIYDELKTQGSKGQVFKVGGVDVIVPSTGDRLTKGLTAYAPAGVSDLTKPGKDSLDLAEKYLGRRTGDFVVLSHTPKDASEFLDIISEELTHRQHLLLGKERRYPEALEDAVLAITGRIPGYRDKTKNGNVVQSPSFNTQMKEGVAKSVAGNALPIPEREAFKAGMERAYTIPELKELRKFQSYGIGGVALALGSEAERKEKLNSKVGVIPEFEQTIRDPQALQKLGMFEEGKKTKEDLRSYFIQSRLQAGNFKEAMNESAAAALYTPKERAELGAFFKAVDEKKLPADIQLGPKGITISGPMAQEAGLGGIALGITFLELSKRILLRKGNSAAAKAIGDYISGNAQKIPARKMGKYFLRNALRGADVLIQTADGEKQVTVE